LEKIKESWKKKGRLEKKGMLEKTKGYLKKMEC